MEMKKMSVKGSALAAALTAAALTAAAAAAAPRRPNVIFFYVDDQGRGMLSDYARRRNAATGNALKVTTPNIDSLIARGIAFDRAHGCLFCAPARASLLTGYADCHAARPFKITNGRLRDDAFLRGLDYASADTPALTAKIDARAHEIEAGFDKNDIRLSPDDPYLARLFKKAGYVTAQVSKLEYGFQTTRRQLDEHGWDAYYGYLDHGRCHAFFPPYLFEKNLGDKEGRVVRLPGNTRADGGRTGQGETYAVRLHRWDYRGKAVWSPKAVQEWALRFIRARAEGKKRDARPFFLFYPTTIPHGPVALPRSNVRYAGRGAGPDSYWPAIHPDVWKTEPALDSSGARPGAAMPPAVPAGPGGLRTLPESRNRRAAFWNDADGKPLPAPPAFDPKRNELTLLEMEYASMVRYFDDYVGQVVRLVRELGLERDTLYVFSADNGHELYTLQKGRCLRPNYESYSEDYRDAFDGNNGHRGLKWDNYEGGVNVPLIVSWPAGGIPCGKRSPDLCANYDLFPTFAELLGLPELARKKDGRSLLPILLEGKHFDKDRAVAMAGGQGPCILTGDGWKLQRRRKGAVQLFHLPSDPGERRDVSAAHPDIVQRLQKRLAPFLTPVRGK